MRDRQATESCRVIAGDADGGRGTRRTAAACSSRRASRDPALEFQLFSRLLRRSMTASVGARVAQPRSMRSRCRLQSPRRAPPGGSRECRDRPAR